MPWTGQELASRHNKSLGGSAASKAAATANAILQKTGDEGKAIRIANWQAKKKRFRRGGPVRPSMYGLDSVKGQT